MKINIKEVFEKDSKDLHVQTNDRLDIDEVFKEALKQSDVEEAVSEDMADPEPVILSDLAEEPEPSNEESEISENETESFKPEQEVFEKETEASKEETESSQEEAEIFGDKEEESQPVADSKDTSDECAAEEEFSEEEEKDLSEEKEEPVKEEKNVCENDEDDDDLPVAGGQAESFYEKYIKPYIPHAAITASFIAIIAVVIIYTTMIPREVNATVNGEQMVFSSKAHNVGDFLEDHNIEFCEEDYISVPLETFIYDGISFEIKHATDFKVTADGKTMEYKSLKTTVGEALKDVGIKVGDKDIVKPKPGAFLADNMNIVIQRVNIKEETVEEDVDFETINKDDSSMSQGESKVTTKGVKGKDQVTYRITYIDGKESSRKEIERKTLKEPVDEVVAKGTKISFNGSSYSRKIRVKAYAYTGGGTTAMGTRARVGEIAVDPSVIPLGSSVYIEGVGERRAEDTGGNIKGNTIDIYMDSESQCRNWGVRYVTVYIK